MDTFIEYLVVKKIDTLDKIKIALLTVAMVLAFILVILVVSNITVIAFLGIFLEMGVIYGYWLLVTSFKIEFEYALTNGELDVDKIISKRKRKRLITVKIREVDIMAPVLGHEDNEFLKQNFKTVIDASSSPLSPNAFFISTHNAKLGLTKLIFEPDQRIIDVCKSTASRKVFDK